MPGLEFHDRKVFRPSDALQRFLPKLAPVSVIGEFSDSGHRFTPLLKASIRAYRARSEQMDLRCRSDARRDRGARLRIVRQERCLRSEV